MKKLSIVLLRFAESMFLRAHGWTKFDKDWWDRPSWYDVKRNDGQPYRTNHAVNSQKWTNAQDEKAKRFKEAGWA